jgi:hypothetical protein
MIETLGEANDLGWRIRVYCRFGKREALKSIRSCTAYVEIDLASLILDARSEFPHRPARHANEVSDLRQSSSDGRVRTARKP